MEKLFLKNKTNLLPFDGELYLFKSYDKDAKLQDYFYQSHLKIDRVKVFGKEYPTPRLQTWYQDQGLSYGYSGHRLEVMHTMPSSIKSLMNKINAEFYLHFNGCLVNFYRDGQDSNGLHRDNEPELGPDPILAILSYGVTRELSLKHLTKKHPTLKVKLEHGDCLLMGRSMQQFWKHGILKSKKVLAQRLSLTFRQVIQG